MIVFSSATSRRNCSTSALVALVGADSTPWAWASEPGATKNNTRSARRFVSERMFFLSQKDLAESRCPAPAHAGALRQAFNRVVYCDRRIDPGASNRPAV